MKTLMAEGPTIADILVWRWDHVARRWTAELRDGTRLHAQYVKRRRGQSHWIAKLGDAPCSGRAHATADPAQREALARWRTVVKALGIKEKP